jgi:hypothetical protein
LLASSAVPSWPFSLSSPAPSLLVFTHAASHYRQLLTANRSPPIPPLPPASITKLLRSRRPEGRRGPSAAAMGLFSFLTKKGSSAAPATAAEELVAKAQAYDSTPVALPPIRGAYLLWELPILELSHSSPPPTVQLAGRELEYCRNYSTAGAKTFT